MNVSTQSAELPVLSAGAFPAAKTIGAKGPGFSAALFGAVAGLTAEVEVTKVDTEAGVIAGMQQVVAAKKKPGATSDEDTKQAGTIAQSDTEPIPSLAATATTPAASQMQAPERVPTSPHKIFGEVTACSSAVLDTAEEISRTGVNSPTRVMGAADALPGPLAGVHTVKKPTDPAYGKDSPPANSAGEALPETQGFTAAAGESPVVPLLFNPSCETGSGTPLPTTLATAPRGPEMSPAPRKPSESIKSEQLDPSEPEIPASTVNSSAANSQSAHRGIVAASPNIDPPSSEASQTRNTLSSYTKDEVPASFHKGKQNAERPEPKSSIATTTSPQDDSSKPTGKTFIAGNEKEAHTNPVASDDLVRVGPHTSQSAEPMRAHAVFETPSANLAGTPIPFAGRASAPPADSNKAPSNPASGLHAERVPPETDFSESGRQHPGFGEPGLPMARVVAQSARSEMHIGMRTSEFGSVEVHTVVRDSQVGISIAAEKGDLRSLLSAEVPAMQTRLGQQELHLEEVKFLPQGASVNVPDAQTGSRQQSFQQQQAPPPGVAANHGREAKEIDVAFTTIGNTAVSPGVRRSLSIHI